MEEKKWGDTCIKWTRCALYEECLERAQGFVNWSCTDCPVFDHAPKSQVVKFRACDIMAPEFDEERMFREYINNLFKGR